MAGIQDGEIGAELTSIKRKVLKEAQERMQWQVQFFRGLDSGYIDKEYEAKYGVEDRLEHGSWTFLGQVNRRLAEKALNEAYERQQAQDSDDQKCDLHAEGFTLYNPQHTQDEYQELLS